MCLTIYPSTVTMLLHLKRWRYILLRRKVKRIVQYQCSTSYIDVSVLYQNCSIPI